MNSAAGFQDTVSALPIRVAIRLFDETHKKRFEQIFRINKKSLNGQWEISGAAEADVVIFDPGDPGGDILLKSSIQNRRKIAVIYSSHNNTDCPWFIRHDANFYSCIQVLNDIQGMLHGRTAGEKNDGCDQVENSGSTAYVMQAIVHMPFPVFHYKDLLSLYCDKPGNRIVIHTPKATQGVTLEKVARVIGSVRQDQLRLEGSSAAACQTVSQQRNSMTVPFDTFCWEVMAIAGNRQLLPDIDAGLFKLRRWPDFTRWSHRYPQILVAAFLKRFAASLDTIQHKTGASREEIIALLNACFMTGLLQEASAVGVATEKNLKPKAEKSLMKKILGSLFSRKED